MPLKLSAAWPSISSRSFLRSRKTGRMRPIHTLWLNHTIGRSTIAPTRSRQSVSARMMRLPMSWIQARNGL